MVKFQKKLKIQEISDKNVKILQLRCPGRTKFMMNSNI